MRYISRFTLICCAGLALLFAPLFCGAHNTLTQAETKPNIVFVLTDDQPYYTLQRMPNVQRLLADEGTTSTETFSSYPLCCPARATLMRGQYAHNHQVLDNHPPEGGYPRFRDEGHNRDNLATRLHYEGYRTALIGKWLNDYETRYVPPGWDEWIVKTGPHYKSTYNQQGEFRDYTGEHMDEMFKNKAEDWLRYAADRGEQQPFFLWAGFYAPHSSGFAPKYEDHQYAEAPDRPDIPYSGAEAERNGDEEYRRQLRDLATVDDFVGRAVTILKKRGELYNTYFVFYTDNGAHPVGYHGLKKGKQAPYSLDTEFPLIVRGPGVARRVKSEALASSNDVMPTMLEIAGAPVPDYTDGRSLRPLFAGETPADWRTGLMSERHGNWRALREDGLKYVAYAGGRRVLYRLDKDPHELDNVYGEAPPEEQSRLASRLEALRNCKQAGCRLAEDSQNE